MSHFTQDPDGNFHQRVISKILYNFNVGFHEHVHEFWLHFNHLLKSFKEIVDTGLSDELLKFIEYFVHPPQKYFPIIRKSLNQVDTTLYKLPFLCRISGFLSKRNNSIENNFRVILVRNFNKQSNSFLSKGNILRIQTFYQKHLPCLQHFRSYFRKVPHGGKSKWFNIVAIALSEKCMQRFLWLT